MRNLAEVLSIATATVLHYTIKVHIAHFNVTGPRFYELHKLLQVIYEALDSSYDSIGEQLRALDIYTPLGMRRILELSILEDFQEVLTAQEFIKELLIDNEQLIEVLNEVNSLSTHQLGLQNFIQGLIDEQEKFGWFLRATVQK